MSENVSREELWDAIANYTLTTVNTPEDDEACEKAQQAVSKVFAELTDLRAHVGDAEEERDQARENEAVALRDLNDIEKRLDTALERAQAFEAALLAVLKTRVVGRAP